MGCVFSDLQGLVKNLGIQCPDCDSAASSWPNVTATFVTEMRDSFYLEEASKSLEMAFAFKLKLQVLSSAALPYLGSIIAESLTKADSPATKAVFNSFSRMNTTAYPPEMVNIKLLNLGYKNLFLGKFL